MRKVYQTKFHTPISKGNCLAACLASLFEVDLKRVPSFEDMDQEEWIDALYTWLEGQDHEIDIYRSNPGGELAKGTYYIAVGTSPRGYRHSVVYRDGYMVHDPHPEGGGLVKVDSYWIFQPCQEQHNQHS